MRTLTLQLVGTTPILLHHISRHQLREQLASKDATLTLDAEALEMMVTDDDGNPSVPVSWIWDAIRVGCSRITVEGKQVSFVKFQSALHLPFGLIPLKDTDGHIPKWKTYSSIQHAAPDSKKSIAVVAPKFDDWMLTLNVSMDDSYDDDFLRKVFIEAGRVGIGLFHPPKKQFGQFRVSFM
jgi:hypothetical protein